MNDADRRPEADHIPYARMVHAVLSGHVPLRPFSPSKDRPFGSPRTAVIGFREAGPGRGGLGKAELRWTEEEGWSLTTFPRGGAGETERLHTRVVPPPAEVAEWVLDVIEKNPERAPEGGVQEDLFSALFADPVPEPGAPWSIEEALEVYGRSLPLTGTVRAPVQMKRKEEKERRINVGVADLTDVMRERLLPKTRFGRFSVRSGTWKRAPCLCIFLDRSGRGAGFVAGLGVATLAGSAGTYESKIEVQHFLELTARISVDHLRKLGRWEDESLRRNGWAGPRAGERLLEEIGKISLEARDHMDLLRRHLEVDPPSTADRKTRPYERDAVGVLFEAFDIDREILADWRPAKSGAPYLNGVPGVQVGPQEKWNIAYDAGKFLDWAQGETRHIAWRMFENTYKTRKMLIANLDSTPHEKNMGVDLVYYNISQGSFVMLQYKVMERSGEELFSRVDDRFLKQVERMRAVDEEFRDESAGNPDIRLVDTPCFVKLCSPVTHMDPSSDLLPGMYLTREHFEIAHAQALSPGRRQAKVGPAGVPRYLTNTEFAMLLSNGWLGSRGTGTEQLKKQLGISLEGGRSVVFGMHVDDRPLTNLSSGL
ncbi:DUF6292 family protein [Nocardiopsis potens]|uniref:DUF6292 family protein n=1 Tax=Nocardiopsis potens TaxID=1246458 RepID=UPI00034DFE16|nr:DUF6292 family protein [Nocardiopsis potens]